MADKKTPKKLTARQERFIDEYVIECNATQAAIKAGYSKANAGKNADRLLKNPRIKALLEKRMSEKRDELIAKQDEVLRYLTRVMRRAEKETIVVTVSEEVEDFAPNDTGKLKKIKSKKEVPATVEIPTKVSDANKAAELLGKRYSLFTDRIDLDADLELNVTIDYGDTEAGGQK